MTEYYYIKDSKSFGPQNIEQLKLVGLDGESLIWAEGFDNWIPLKDIPELSNVLLTRKSPPPIPLNIINKHSRIEQQQKAPVNKIVEYKEEDEFELAYLNDINESHSKPNLKTASKNTKAANEIVANFNMIVLGCVLAFVFIIGFYIVKNPKLETSIDNDYQNSSRYFQNSTGNPDPRILTIDEHSQYDEGFVIPETNTIDALNEHRMSNFKEDLKEKFWYSFIICIPLCLIGRYAVKGLLWVEKNSH